MKTRRNRKPMAEMNIVPYVDVMLVLLVIFMASAPLIMQGVKVDLPQAKASPLPQKKDPPILVTVNQEGQLFLNISEHPQLPLLPQQISRRVSLELRSKPERPVLIQAAKKVRYEAVVSAMVLLQKAGVGSVGLVTEQAEDQG